MSASSTVAVSNLALGTTKQALEDFFSFCGTIDHVQLAASGTEAQVTFASSSAASNAAMLNGGTLNNAAISVSLPTGTAPPAAAAQPAAASPGHTAARQEDKPKTAIVAEYLAAGYKLSDDIAKRALDLDQSNGYSNKFHIFLSHLDRKLGEKTAAPPASGTAAPSTQETALGMKAAEAGEGPVAPSEKEAHPSPSPSSSSAAPPSFVANVQDKFNQQLQDPSSLVSQAQTHASNFMARPEVTNLWSTLGDYYNKAANHPQIHKFYTDTSRSVQDVRSEAQRIAQDKYGITHRHHMHQLFQPATETASGGEAASAPAPEAPGKASLNWVLVLLLVLSAFTASVSAHGDDNGAAAIAGVTPPQPGQESYIQKHMANEHHINAFDMGSFFTLHDLNRDGVWDRSEVEAIYGVHHSMSIKHSPTAEVHDEKADKIVKEVFKRLDLNGDAMITKNEFFKGGAEALPAFEEYGIGVLGHHYDAESEFFVHHEEKYHNSPETQTEEAYNHPEDVEHFMAHQKIEDEEENRERKAEGMPSIEEEAKLRAEAEAKGETFKSEYEERLKEKRPEDKEFHEVEQDAYYGGFAQDEAAAQQHVFRGPGGTRVVKSHAAGNASHADNVAERLPGETDDGYQQRKELYESRLKAAAYFDKLEKDQKARIAKAAEKLKQEAGESEEAFIRRLNKAKWEAAQRDDYGKGEKGFARPKDDADRLRKGTPYKNRMKKGSYFGEF